MSETEVAAGGPGDRRWAGMPSQLVVCSLEAWDEVHRRNQLLVLELLDHQRELRVLFVEPPVDVPYELREGRRPARPGLRRIDQEGRLWALRPYKVLPRILGPAADRSLSRQVRRAAARVGLARPVLWVNDVAFAPLAQTTRWPLLYDVTDDWLVATATPRELARRRRHEDDLLRRASAVVVCSPELARRKGRARAVVVIENGVDAVHLRSPRPRPPDLPPGPVALYLGTLHEDRLDVELCLETARAIRPAQLVLVGPVALADASRRVLLAEANVSLLGPRPYREVPGYLQHADVLVVPHRRTPFTESLDPIKARECLAVGRPTVATEVGGFRGLGPPVRTVPVPAFPGAVAAALAEAPPPGPGPLPEGLASWSDRAAAMAEALRVAASAEPPLRVAYVDHCAQLSGAELALVRLVGSLPGVEAEAVLAEDGPLAARLSDAGVAVRVEPLDPATRRLSRTKVGAGRPALGAAFRTLAYARRLARGWRRDPPDLVATNSLKAALYGGLAGRLAGLPVVWHLRDRLAPDYLPRAAVVLCRAAAWFLPTVVVANSEATLATLGLARHRPGLRTFVVGDPCPLAAGGPQRAASSAPSSEPFVVGMVGRLAAWKGQDVFLRAFAAAFPAGTEQAVVVGASLFDEGGYAAGLARLVSSLGIAGRVELTGQVEDVESQLRRFDVLVHASVVPEPFGQVVVEGMALGLAVVASDGGGPAELITDGVDGLLSLPGDVEALAARLRRLRDDPGLRVALGRAAAVRARDFAPERIGGEVTRAYRSALP